MDNPVRFIHQKGTKNRKPEKGALSNKLKPQIVKNLIFKSGLFFFFAIFILTGCEKEVMPSFQDNGPKFNIDLFEQNLQDALDGKVTGYSYSISQNGNKYADGADGHAVVPVRGQGGVDQSPNKRMTIASISKTMTAIAFYKVCEQVNMVIETPIKWYIPQSWTVHESMEDVTFGDLLRHESGIKEGGSSYEGLREIVENGVNPADKGGYHYINANYAFFRIIIPHILHYQDMFDIKDDHDLLETETAMIFRQYLQDEVFSPVGINNVKWTPAANNPTLCYDYNDESNPWLTGDYNLTAGPYGLYLSSNNILNVFAHAKYVDSYLAPEYRDLLLNEGMGTKKKYGDHGLYPSHGGDWKNNGRGMTGLVMSFPNNVEATLLINCRNGAIPSKYTVMIQAYDNAWE